MYDKTWREVHRSIDRSPLQVLPGLDEEILDVMAFNLPPGDYFMAVKVRDLKSKRTQVIRDSLRVEGYEGDTLRMSGIEIARRIEPTTEEGKFVKQGLEVIPMPSLTFKRNKDVFLYCRVPKIPSIISWVAVCRPERSEGSLCPELSDSWCDLRSLALDQNDSHRYVFGDFLL